jgi:rubrerythrin
MMSFGAPADLLLAIQEAAADEVKHAQVAAEIYGALSQQKVKLGEFPLEGISLSSNRVSLIETLIREACFAETLGVAEVREALKHCQNSFIANHLAQVFADESRHATLAWRSLKWLIESADPKEQESLRLKVEQSFYDMAKGYQVLKPEQATSQPQKTVLNTFGVLSQEQIRSVRIQAFHEVILPALNHAGWSGLILKELKHSA